MATIHHPARDSRDYEYHREACDDCYGAELREMERADLARRLAKPTRETRKMRKPDTSELALPKPNPARDSDYRAYVRSHPCAIKGRSEHRCEGPIECAHIRTAGFGLKSSDYATIPLCAKAHRFTQHNIGWSEFMIRFDFNPWQVAFLLLERWHRSADR